MNAIKEYENNKWKAIGAKVGKPAKACEQYAKEHFPGMLRCSSGIPHHNPDTVLTMRVIQSSSLLKRLVRNLARVVEAPGKHLTAGTIHLLIPIVLAMLTLPKG